MTGKLFTHGSSKDWMRRSAVAGGRQYTRAYTPSYYEAAETLVQAALQDNKPADLLFCPIVYLYRHFVELMLKDLIRQAQGYCKLLESLGIAHGQPKKNVLPELTETHSLKRLLDWLIERLEVVGDKETFDDGVRVTIEQLHSFDPEGVTFRYGYTTKGKLTLPKQQQYDIEIIRSRMKEVNDYLCGIEAWLDFNSELAREWAAMTP